MKTKVKNCANSTQLNCTRRGFTLIELMIVFVIIIVLAGMVLRLMNLSGVRNAEASTRERLERVAQALEEFRATYGRYPPVDYYPGIGQPFGYEYANAAMMPPTVQNTIRSESTGPNKKNLWSADGTGRVFTFGLLSYFFPRYNSHASESPRLFIGGSGSAPPSGGVDPFNKNNSINQWSDYNKRDNLTDIGDIVQNLESSRRILPFLGASLSPTNTVESYGIVYHGATAIREVSKDSGLEYQNMVLTIYDGWGEHELHYESRPPYDSYKLWSNGPDGKSGTEDDMVLGQD